MSEDYGEILDLVIAIVSLVVAIACVPVALLSASRWGSFAILIGLIIATAVVHQQRLFAMREALRMDIDNVLTVTAPCPPASGEGKGEPAARVGTQIALVCVYSSSTPGPEDRPWPESPL